MFVLSGMSLSSFMAAIPTARCRSARLRRSQPATHIRVSVTAVNTEVTMPIISTTAKPRIGPVPNMNMITAAMTLVMLASKIARLASL